MRNNKSLSDKLLNECDRFLKIVAHRAEQPQISTPLTDTPVINLSQVDKKNIQGLMRINHTGEVCAQALYYGQAMLAKDKQTHEHLIQAAQEEHNHLYWCQERLDDLDANPSVLNPFWYISSFALGAVAALFGDKVSYGFVIEVEKQVEDHLQEHLQQIPKCDIKTIAILKQMQMDEIRHGEDAKKAGGIKLPRSIKTVMTGMSKFMKFLVYRL